MIEMPEAATLARQMKVELTGKTITRFARGTQVQPWVPVSTSRTVHTACLHPSRAKRQLHEDCIRSFLWFWPGRKT